MGDPNLQIYIAVPRAQIHEQMLFTIRSKNVKEAKPFWNCYISRGSCHTNIFDDAFKFKKMLIGALLVILSLPFLAADKVSGWLIPAKPLNACESENCSCGPLKIL